MAEQDAGATVGDFFLCHRGRPCVGFLAACQFLLKFRDAFQVTSFPEEQLGMVLVPGTLCDRAYYFALENLVP